MSLLDESNFRDYVRYETRRQFFARGMNAVGWAALASLLLDRDQAHSAAKSGEIPKPMNDHAPRTKHVIYLHMVGGPPQMDLFDYKPQMNAWFDKDLPDSVRMGVSSRRMRDLPSGRRSLRTTA